jgi:hypothetical protein
MAAPCIAPTVEPPVEEKKTVQVREPKPVVPQQPVRSLLLQVFEGHLEFLGWTPD